MSTYRRPRWYLAVALCVAYIALDWASYIHPLHGLNITPWSPAPAIALVFLLRYRAWAILPVAAAILLADAWVRNLPAPLHWSVLIAVLLALGYWGIAEGLRRSAHNDGIFHDRRGLLAWSAAVCVGTCVNGLVFVSSLSLAGLIPTADFKPALIQHWVGDCVGIVVTMPIVWMLSEENGRALLRSSVLVWESIGYALATLLALWGAFGLGAEADFKYFYLLFLPIAWAAARQGLPGAVASALLMQLGIIGAVQILDFSTVTVLEIQILAVVLALFGFFIGVEADEKQRVSEELRQTLHLAAAGKMAGALAHELNQPLTALTTYGAASEAMLEGGETGARLRDTIHRMVTEANRAAAVVRRLRDFFQTGATHLEACDVEALLRAATQPFLQPAAAAGVVLEVVTTDRANVLADRIQVEIVLRNLIANALDAVVEQSGGTRHIRVVSSQRTPGRVLIRVEDSGPGISGPHSLRLFEPFHTSKSSGLGLGLTLSRAIAEAHGGQLWAEVGEHGVFNLELPCGEVPVDVS